MKGALHSSSSSSFIIFCSRPPVPIPVAMFNLSGTRHHQQHIFFFFSPPREISSSSSSPAASFSASIAPTPAIPSTLSSTQAQTQGNLLSSLLLPPRRSDRKTSSILRRRLHEQQQQQDEGGTVIFGGKDFLSEFGFKTLFYQAYEEIAEDGGAEEKAIDEKKDGRTRKAFRLKVGNASAKRLVSGALAGAVSRTAVAPLETIRTHLMVGSAGHSVSQVFHHIMLTEGWKGLFRGNGVNVIRVAPSKAIELFSYDTIKKVLDKTSFVPSHLPVPTSSIAGAAAGVCSTICTYPLELLKTRLTIQRGVYKNLMDAFVRICEEEGPRELYRGLTPSLIGVIPYAATNYFAYDFLRKLYKRATRQNKVGNLPTLLIGSAAGAFASASTYPLEVARKHMQVGALSGRPAYDNLLHAFSCILEQQGPAGLYRGLAASCFKLIPAAGISFMCYEACKRILIEDETG